MKFAAGEGRGTTSAWQVKTIRIRDILDIKVTNRKTYKVVLKKKKNSFPVCQLNLDTQLLVELFLQLIKS